MKIWTFIIRFWDFISRQGVSDDFLKENQMTTLLNRAATFTSWGAFNIFVVTYLTNQDIVYMTVTMTVTIMYALIPILHHFKKIRWVRLYFAILLPLWYTFTLLCIGGNFSQSITATATLTITYVLFDKEKQLRMKLMLYNILIYVLPVTYLAFYPPFFGVRNYPFDEVVVFLLCIGWLSVIFLIYQSEKEALIKDLQEKNKALERTTEELEQFTYIASHDLKSPLRNVISFLGLAERKIERKQYEDLPRDLEFAKKGAEQMHYLISDILELSRINVNSKEQREWIDLNDIIEKSISNLQQEISEKDAIVNLPDLPVYLCNSVEFAIVFQNIIQNGIKYNKSAIPIVNIQTEETDSQLLIHFDDNGIGIEEKYFDRIFQFFKRLHTQKEYKGTGLGLGLCKKIIQSYNGDISVKSKTGEGSVFTVQLPHLLPSENNKKG